MKGGELRRLKRKLDPRLTLPGDPSLPPGAARNPGLGVQDIIRQESSGDDPGLTAERYEFLGDEDVPFARYTSEEFYEREIERMWSRVWQWACREEHIPKVGDYVVYDVGPYSALVIRDEAGAIRAFVNSCPHRGMQFADPGSSGRSRLRSSRGCRTDSRFPPPRQ